MTQHKIMQALGDNPESLTPMGNYLIIEFIEGEEKTPGGLVLPDQVKAREVRILATVRAVGPGQVNFQNMDRIPMDLKVGDVVLVRRFGHEELKLGEKTYYVIAQGDVTAKVDPLRLAEALKINVEEGA